MKNLPSSVKKFLSLEPLFEFDLDTLFDWIVDINPRILAIGLKKYDKKNLIGEIQNKHKIIDLISRLKSEKRFNRQPEKVIYLNGKIAKLYFGKKAGSRVRKP